MRRAVLDATLAELIEGGDLETLSIATIARRAGVHPTSVYRRWGDRVNLALDAVLSQTEAEVPTPDTGSLRGDLIALFRSVAAFVETPLGDVLVWIAQKRDLPELETARARFWMDRFRIGAALLQRAEDRGELRLDVNPLLALETLVGPLLLRRLLTRESLDDAFIRDLVDLVLRGIGRQPALRPPDTGLPSIPQL
ncbi:MAG TPA: TetR/AcrR family transcriptional regulator C-terminal ligand-binding domain-containing protein [Candidatus Binatia bacterium]|nr:TetR/AcrR family transcriptional regulator C-terminal ligand-binding domain-containing protein [Candidatus Binatia bacterium]